MPRRWPLLTLVAIAAIALITISGSALANPPGDGSVTYTGHIYIQGQPYAYTTGPFHMQATLWSASTGGGALQAVAISQTQESRDQ